MTNNQCIQISKANSYHFINVNRLITRRNKRIIVLLIIFEIHVMRDCRT